MDGFMVILLTLALAVPAIAAAAGLVAVLIAVGMTLIMAGPSAVARWVSDDDPG